MPAWAGDRAPAPGEASAPLDSPSAGTIEVSGTPSSEGAADGPAAIAAGARAFSAAPSTLAHATMPIQPRLRLFIISPPLRSYPHNRRVSTRRTPYIASHRKAGFDARSALSFAQTRGTTSRHDDQ